MDLDKAAIQLRQLGDRVTALEAGAGSAGGESSADQGQDEQIAALTTSVNALETNLTALTTRVDAIEARVDAIEADLEPVEEPPAGSKRGKK